MKQGFVISDLHLFSRRSDVDKYLPQIREALQSADCLVINGDITDFWWTYLPDLDTAIDRTVSWVKDLLAVSSKLQIYLTIGNHDNFSGLIEKLSLLDRVTVEPLVLRLGSNIFVHGDMCNGLMSKEDLLKKRESVGSYSIKGWPWHLLYELIVQTRLHRIAYLIHPNEVMATRILYFLKSCEAGILDGVSDIYFGHTHSPFSGFEYEGIRFHNTGSAIRGLKFNMRPFHC